MINPHEPVVLCMWAGLKIASPPMPKFSHGHVAIKMAISVKLPMVFASQYNLAFDVLGFDFQRR